jgi:hypothetical protein
MTGELKHLTGPGKLSVFGLFGQLMGSGANVYFGLYKMRGII